HPRPPLCIETATPAQLEQELPVEFGPRGGEMTGLAAKSLASLGIQAVPVSLGGNLIDVGDASSSSHDGFQSTTGPIPLFARPPSPMRTIAETTGGEVVTSASQLPATLSAFDSAYVVSYRSEHASDGKIHNLQVKSLREGLTVRSPAYMTEGT